MAWKAAIVAMLALTMAGCANAAERTLLSQFFAASRLRDLTAVSRLATVVFEPATDGIVTSFDLLGIAVLQTEGRRPVLEEATISAPVKLPDGGTVVKTFVVTMQRDRIAGQTSRDAWTITAFRAVPASPSTPRS